MPCPHGTCASCTWHTVDRKSDCDGDPRNLWRCWKNSGVPEVRLDAMNDTEPPGCESHLKAPPRGSA